MDEYDTLEEATEYFRRPSYEYDANVPYTPLDEYLQKRADEVLIIPQTAIKR